MSFFEDLKYDNPGVYRAAVGCLATVVAVVIVAVIPDNDATKAMGLTALRERASALQAAVYWQSRAMLNPEGEVQPVVEYGFVVGIDFDKQVYVTMPDNETFVRRKFKLADITVTDVHGVAAVIAGIKQIDARIDVYGEMAVIWIDDKPLNVDLVNAGLATPDPNPPTNIVDRTFAAYFWKIVKGNQNET